MQARNTEGGGACLGVEGRRSGLAPPARPETTPLPKGGAWGRAPPTRPRPPCPLHCQEYPDYYRVLQTSDGAAVALSAFEGKKPVVLAFYPKASTPGCTKEMCAFRDAWRTLQDAGAEVFGISGDAPAVNDAFRRQHGLPFPLLSDPSNLLRRAFGIKGDLLGLLPGRQTIVIAKDGTVAKVFNSQFDIDSHVTEAAAAVKGLA